MLRCVALGLAVLGLTGTMAFGQVMSINSTDGRGYGGYAVDDTGSMELWITDYGDLIDFSAAIATGDAVTISNIAVALQGGFESPENPVGWSQFFDPPADTTGGVLSATFDVTIAGGDAVNSGLGIDTSDPQATFINSSSGAPVNLGGLAAGGQLVAGVPIPEPATMALLLAGMGGGLVARRRRRS